MENKENLEINIDELRSMITSQEEQITSWEEEPEEPAIEEIETTAAEKKNTDSAAKVSVSWTKNLLLYVHDLIYLLAVLIVVSLLLLRVVVVSGTSMNKTLLEGDYLLVLSNALYHEPKQGDVVVVSKESFDNGSPIVKRVIATEGQTVDINFTLGIVYVDGVALDEPYTNTATTLQEGVSFPLTVDEGCIFVLGDNRAVSRDSRSPDIGQIAVEEVLGKVVFLFLPGTNGTDVFGNPNEPRDFTRIGVVE